MSLLDIQGLQKSYPAAGGRAATPVLQSLSLQMEEGQTIAVLGQSGSGKTTLLRVIAGFEPYQGGSVAFDGRPVQGPSPQRFMVFQSYDQLLPWKTIAQNLAFAICAVYPHKTKGEAREEALHWLGQTGLADWHGAYPRQLSGGMKQRAAIARAFALRPRLLLLDEPFSGLDMALRGKMRGLLQSLCRQNNVAALFVTHDVDEAFALCPTPRLLRSGGRELLLLNETTDRAHILQLLQQ